MRANVYEKKEKKKSFERLSWTSFVLARPSWLHELGRRFKLGQLSWRPFKWHSFA